MRYGGNNFIFLKINCQINTFSAVYTSAYVLFEALGDLPLIYATVYGKGNCRKWETLEKSDRY